jgi:hypothetical protein
VAKNHIPKLVANGALTYGHSAWFTSAGVYPSAYLSIYPECVEIDDTLPTRHIVLKREEIKVVRSAFLNGIQIVHRSGELRPYLIFKSPCKDQLWEEFERSGYPMSPNVSQIESFGDGIRMPIGPLFAALVCFVVAELLRHRMFDFLVKSSVLSAGRSIATSEFSRFAGGWFFVAGSVCVAWVVLVLISQLRQSKEKSTPRPDSSE